MFMNGNLYEERGEDRRIRKSKKALQEALIRLLSKKSIGEITIKELTDEADVPRHLLPPLCGRDGFEGADRAGDCRAADRNLEQRAAKQTGARTLPAAGSGAGISGGQPRDCQDAGKRARCTVEELCAGISERCLGAQLFGEQLKYGSRFCAAGLREMLVSWIEDGMRMAPGEMARIMERMMGSQSPTAMSR